MMKEENVTPDEEDKGMPFLFSIVLLKILCRKSR